MSHPDRPLVVRRRRSALLAAPLALVLVLIAATFAGAQGGDGPRPPAAPPGAPPGAHPAADPNVVLGTRHFDEAIRYVSRGRGGITEVRDFYVKLDAKLTLDTTQHEGEMRLWFVQPSQYRQELTTGNVTTTKILAGEGGWTVTPNGRVQNLMMSEEGRATLRQVKEDRARLADIAQFLAPETLKGPGVTFTFEGFKQGRDTYAGDWIKVVRRAPGKGNISFWLAYAKDPRTGEAVATWPGVVRVEGDPNRRDPTEDYLLREWEHPSSQQREFRYPRRIEAYSLLRGRDGQPVAERFLFATIEDVKINVGIDPSRFRPPSVRPGGTNVPGAPGAR